MPSAPASALPWHPHPDGWSARPGEAHSFPCSSACIGVPWPARLRTEPAPGFQYAW